MKKLVTISLFVFWAIAVAVIAAGLISRDQSNLNQVNNIAPNINSNTSLVLTSAELAKHNSSNSCWLLISGKIYDVTTFLRQHPGGTSSILPTCGTDATTAYASRGGTGSHSSSAYAMLDAYYIGNLNQTINASLTAPASTNTPAKNFGNNGEEFDD